MVSGGPYGLEDVISGAGYNRALLLLLITPIVWSLPVCLLIGELAAALPQDGGYYVWVERGLGPFWGFQEAWLSLAASIFDMAIYPTIFLDYLARFWPPADHGLTHVLIGAAVIAACVVWNIAGVRAVGEGSSLLMIALLAPFAVAAAMAWLHAPLAASPVRAGSAGLLGAFTVAMWNYMGWDNASTIAGEVERPQRTYPKAMLGAVALVTISYLIPVAAVKHTGLDPSTWSTGAWVDAGRAIGGNALAAAIVAGGMICGVGMFNALVLSYSRVPLAMARDGYLPRIFARTTARTGAPWVSIVACAAAWTLCLTLQFERLVVLDIMLYGLSLLLEFAALFALRVREPQLARPFRVRGGLPMIALLSCGPAAALVIAFVQQIKYGEKAASAIPLALAVIAGGIVIYGITRMVKKASA
jgi:amino acid transporter